jgi:diaminohydroxyphosphoribosylaminopyrimidine deaminase/5-amino-6-(5-phosphoribosylamino)uracil reductase
MILAQKYMQKTNTTYNPESFMKRCIELAGNGLGTVAPNPMVGAVLVHNNKVIGEGYHKKYGSPHAEVNAINAVHDKSLLKKCTLYVNLEPCAHTGKTPPCSDLIIEKGIPEVFIGTIDPNSLVAGKGIEKLRKAGVKVNLGILENECRELNKRFFTFYQKRRPYIILKWAQTTDGFIDITRKAGDPIGINWISNSISQMLVHKWRGEEQAILVGSNTVLSDNPQLTVRQWNGKNPLRIVFDNKLELPDTAKVFDNTSPTLILNEEIDKVTDNKEYIKLKKNSKSLDNLMVLLYEREIQSLIIEGGKKLLESFIKKNLWDEARILIGNKEFSKGLKAPEIQITSLYKNTIINDKLLVYRNDI